MSRAFCFRGRLGLHAIHPDRVATMIERDVLMKATLSGMGMLTSNYK